MSRISKEVVLSEDINNGRGQRIRRMENYKKRATSKEAALFLNQFRLITESFS